eukprot:750448-Hanusia_phi.AAC.7
MEEVRRWKEERKEDGREVEMKEGDARSLCIPLLDTFAVPRAQQAEADFAIRVEVGVQTVAEGVEEDGGRDGRIVGAAREESTVR